MGEAPAGAEPRWRRALRAAFVAAAAAMLFSAMAHAALGELAPWAFGVKPYLSGGTASAAATVAEIKADPVGALLGGSLARKVDDYANKKVGEFVPFHDSLLVLSSGLQRLGISAANRAAGYDVLPTYYGSSYVCIPGDGVVMRKAKGPSEVNALGLVETLVSYRLRMCENPDVQWYFYLCEEPDDSPANPTMGLVTGGVGYRCYIDRMRAAFGGDAAVIEDCHDEWGSYLDERFATDHHWNIDGALRGYRAIEAAMGLDRVEVGGPALATADRFYGSAARASLCLDFHDEGVWDVDYDISGLGVTVDGEVGSAADVDRLSGTGSPYEKGFELENLYGCFHEDYGLMVLEDGSAGDGVLLIVGDSFSNPIERFFTANFGKVVVCDMRHSDRGLQWLIDEFHPDSVLSVQSAGVLFDPGQRAAAI